MTKSFAYLSALLLLLPLSCGRLKNIPETVEIPSGHFVMGSPGEGENYDEAPMHTVVISYPFRMGKTEVTNVQYREFDPSHEGDDSSAVVDVSYYDATAYCEWLSKKTGKYYRLPTEAEWEYACRAGSVSAYNTGDSLAKEILREQDNNRVLKPVCTRVAQTPPNAFGLYDMHGNVEEWCSDWYGPYSPENQENPSGPTSGIFRVSRGGSHNTEVEYLRSANRMAATPDDSHSLLGFRVVEVDKKVSLNHYDAPVQLPLFARDVSAKKAVWDTSEAQKPLWKEPIPFVVEPSDNTPFYSHNHQPSITWCENGDLLAIWFSCEREAGREMVVLASRLRQGEDAWSPASLFFKVPDRNMTGSAITHLPDGRLLHLNGVSCAGEWQNLALCARFSDDNGASWTAPRLVEPWHEKRHQVISGTIVTFSGAILQCCDASPEGQGGTSLHASYDGGKTWRDLWDAKPVESFKNGSTGSYIAGIHAGIVELRDGSLLAFGRGDSIDGKMPQSISRDGGKTWEYSASVFPAIGSGQRLTLLRLREGPIMLSSFGENGLFVSISQDEGRSWSTPKLMTDGKVRTLNGGAHTGEFRMDAKAAEPKGYTAGCQTPDGVIHLISSRLHYRFNLAWILN